MSEEPATEGTTRREIIAKGMWVAPAILTLAAAPAFASAGSGYDGGGKYGATGENEGDNGKHLGWEKKGKHLGSAKNGD